MRPALRILSLEDDPEDVVLIQAQLEAENITFELTRVETQPAFVDALEQGNIHLILADYTLPSFDGASALKIALEKCPDVPFIFVSGTLGEEVAIEALKVGATDYVLKTRLSRLVPSVRRALREAEERTELNRSEEALRRSEAYLAEAQKLSHTGSFGWDVSSGEICWSRETFRIFEYGPTAKVTVEMILQRTHPEDRAAVRQLIERVSCERREFDFEHRLLLPDGSVKYLRVVGHPSTDESSRLEFVGAVTDITERKQAETDLQKAVDEIKKLRDQLYKENIALREEIDKASMFEEIVGDSPGFQAVLASVARVAPTDSSVLIAGETGVGKELIARALHKRSHRSQRAFVTVNCAALSPTLISSELFGHEKGAFTGAMQRRLGRFELADGGTIFLDEVGELPADAQIALLRVLQEREFERVGGTHPIRVDVRVIAATNRNLGTALANGTFRSDLFYRLNVFPIEVPPLRERKDDVLTLLEFFVHRFARKLGKAITQIDKRTIELFRSYDWPGNIRELQNIVERSVILCNGDTFWVDESWLSSQDAPQPGSSGALKETLQSHEKEMIEAALAESKGKVAGPSGAAAKLGIPRSTLDAKIKQLKIEKHIVP